MVESLTQGKLTIPTVLFPDGSFLVDPTLEALAEKAGIRVTARTLVRINGLICTGVSFFLIQER